MKMKEFMASKISVTAETKQEAERFLNTLAKKGVLWRNGDRADYDNDENAKAGATYAIGFLNPNRMGRATSDRAFYEKRGTPNKPYKLVTVKEFFEEVQMYKKGDRVVVSRDKLIADERMFYRAETPICIGAIKEVDEGDTDMPYLIQLDGDRVSFWALSHGIVGRVPDAADERIVIARAADGSVTCEHTKDGKTLASSSVKRYYKDTDDLRVAAKFALEKLAPRGYKVGDRVVVRKDLVAAKIYGNNGVVSEMLAWRGKVVTITRGDEGHGFGIKEDGWCWTPEMFSGLATITPPFDEEGQYNYKIGQRVRMRKGYCYSEPFVGEIVDLFPTDGRSRGRMSGYKVEEPTGRRYFQYTADIIGLEDET